MEKEPKFKIEYCGIFFIFRSEKLKKILTALKEADLFFMIIPLSRDNKCSNAIFWFFPLKVSNTLIFRKIELVIKKHSLTIGHDLKDDIYEFRKYYDGNPEEQFVAARSNRESILFGVNNPDDCRQFFKQQLKFYRRNHE